MKLKNVLNAGQGIKKEAGLLKGKTQPEYGIIAFDAADRAVARQEDIARIRGEKLEEAAVASSAEAQAKEAEETTTVTAAASPVIAGAGLGAGAGVSIASQLAAQANAKRAPSSVAFSAQSTAAEETKEGVPEASTDATIRQLTQMSQRKNLSKGRVIVINAAMEKVDLNMESLDAQYMVQQNKKITLADFKPFSDLEKKIIIQAGLKAKIDALNESASNVQSFSGISGAGWSSGGFVKGSY